MDFYLLLGHLAQGGKSIKVSSQIGIVDSTVMFGHVESRMSQEFL